MSQIGAVPMLIDGVAAHNLGPRSTDLGVANIEVTQLINQQVVPLKVITYEDPMAEERNRQILRLSLRVWRLVPTPWLHRSRAGSITTARPTHLILQFNTAALYAAPL